MVIDRDRNAARNLAQLATTPSSAGRAAQDVANACGEDLRPEYVGLPSLMQEPNRILGPA